MGRDDEPEDTTCSSWPALPYAEWRDTLGDAAPLDAGRRQGAPRAHALAQSRLAGAALRHRARARHSAIHAEAAAPRDRLRLRRSPARRAQRPCRRERIALEPMPVARVLSPHPRRARRDRRRGPGRHPFPTRSPSRTPVAEDVVPRGYDAAGGGRASGARCSRPIACSHLSHRRFSARQARSTSSGAASISR